MTRFEIRAMDGAGVYRLEYSHDDSGLGRSTLRLFFTDGPGDWVESGAITVPRKLLQRAAGMILAALERH